MKRILILITVIIMTAGMVFADGHGFYGSPEGDWTLRGARLTQTDEGATRAKAWLSVPQKTAMVYEFTMRYEGGGEDGHGGAGLHIVADNKTDGKSWGFSDSWLLWINYDMQVSRSNDFRGLNAMVYKSDSNKVMDVVASVNLDAYAGLLMDNLDVDIPVKLTFYPANGRVEIADPRGETAGWYVDIPGAAGATGSYVAVRTNGVAVSFTSPDVSM